jgi:predicted  nucleic acid-binding Zn-ribbon protein
MGKLATGVENELQKKMEDLGFHLQQTSDQLEELSPQINRIKNSVFEIESYITSKLDSVIKQSAELTQDSIASAQDLHKLLEVLLGTVLQTNAEVAAKHEKSLDIVKKKADENLSSLLTALSTAVASSMSLQNEMVC